MNKQPFYHCGHFTGKKLDIEKIVKSTQTVLKDTVEYYDNELLFTATSNVSYIINKKLAKIGIIGDVEAEPGDPCDLM